MSSAQESADERMEARVLIGAECSWLTEEANKVAGRDVKRHENANKKEMRRVLAKRNIVGYDITPIVFLYF